MDPKTAKATSAPGTGVKPDVPVTPASTNIETRDVYGDKRISLDSLPVIGYEKGSRFTPVEKAGAVKPEPQEPAATDGDEEVVEGENGQPDNPADGKTVVNVLKAKNGKTFKDATELLSTYENSTTEAVRLAGETKTLKISNTDLANKLNEANQSILAMQEYLGNAAFMPNIPEKYKDMTEREMLDSMTEDEKFDYMSSKRDWKNKVTNFKDKLATAKEESERIAKATAAEITRNEAIMAQDTAKFPDFEVLAPLRAEILAQSSHLANRPDSPYISYFMAYGIAAKAEKDEATRLEAESRSNAAARANADAANSNSGVPPTPEPKKQKKDDGLRGLVSAAKSIKNTF